MCGRFSLAVRIGALAERFGVTEPQDLILPRFNIAPGEQVPVLVSSHTDHSTGEITLSQMEWGIIPPWSTGPRPAVHPINLRSEGLAGGRSPYGSLVEQGRCIIPATGFYEWKATGSRKYPYYFSIKDKALFGLAGLCSLRESPDGPLVGSFAILTTRPNSLVQPYHDRMPVILSREHEAAWLGGMPGPARDLVEKITSPYPPGMMEVVRVTPRVNDPAFKERASTEADNYGTLDGFMGYL